jgi:hypothetical protein
MKGEHRATNVVVKYIDIFSYLFSNFSLHEKDLAVVNVADSNLSYNFVDDGFQMSLLFHATRAY